MNRPKTRMDCMGWPRPCPWLSCTNHLFWMRHNYNPKGKKTTADAILEEMTDEEILEEIFSMPETCVLDVAASGPHTLEAIGNVMGVTRERVRQIEDGQKGAIHRMRHCTRANELKDFWQPRIRTIRYRRGRAAISMVEED